MLGVGVNQDKEVGVSELDTVSASDIHGWRKGMSTHGSNKDDDPEWGQHKVYQKHSEDPCMLGVVVHAGNPSAWEVEAEGLI